MATFNLLVVFFSFITVYTIRIRTIDDIESSLISGNTAFGHEISSVLYEDASSNLWISPFSITSCFALVYPGSAGSTQSQIANVMGYPTNSDVKDVTEAYFDLQSSIENTYDGAKTSNHSWSTQHRSLIGIANKIYSSKSLALKQSYVDTLDVGEESFIDADFDFASSDAAQTINNWVSDSTDGLITQIVNDNQDLSQWQFVAMNAIYLNATFKLQFKEQMTSKNAFYSNLQRTQSVADCHLMHQLDHFDYHQDDHYQYLKFPFNDNEDLFILFALPRDSSVYETQNGLITDWNVVNEAINNLESTFVALALPKLSIEMSYTLNEPLQDLGMTNAFSPSADFSGITNESLYIDTVIHKTMVEMDENGLVAAAVTAIVMFKSAFMTTERPVPVLFKADHSFQMFIIDGEHQNTVLFMGQINNPGIPEGSDEPTYNESSDPVWYVEPQPVISVAAVSTGRSSTAVTAGIIVLVAAALVMFYGVMRTRKMKDETSGVGKWEALEEVDDDDVDTPMADTMHDDGFKIMASPPSSERALMDE